MINLSTNQWVLSYSRRFPFILSCFTYPSNPSNHSIESSFFSVFFSLPPPNFLKNCFPNANYLYFNVTHFDIHTWKLFAMCRKLGALENTYIIQSAAPSTYESINNPNTSQPPSTPIQGQTYGYVSITSFTFS